MLEDFIIKKLLTESYEYVKKLIKKELIKIDFTHEDIINSLNFHLKEVAQWSNSISFKEMIRPKQISDVYTELDIQLVPRKLLPKDRIIQKKTIDELILNDYHLVILGDPGCGKTTTIKNVCRKLITGEVKELDKFSFPIVIKLRELDFNETIFDRIRTIFNIRLKAEKRNELNKKEYENFDFKSEEIKYILSFVDSLGALLLIDGLDELNPTKFSKSLKELRLLYQNLTSTKIVVTCRSGAFNISLENSEVHQICYLDNNQINTFVLKWFEDSQKGLNFLTELKNCPFEDTAIRPLTLAHLCVLFDKYQKIPDKPKTVYKKLINLLIEEWDNQRQIERESEYSNFEPDRKFDFLTHFAFELNISFPYKTYCENEMKLIYKKIHMHFGLPKIEVKKVINEIETHNGLIINSSYETFEFAHKSIQEYLTAEYLIRMPKISKKYLVDTNLFNELAIAVCLSSDPNEYFAYLIFDVFQKEFVSQKNIEEFLHRLIIEKPDFIVSPILGLAIYYIYTNYYVNNEYTFFNEGTVENENNFEEIFNKITLNYNLKKSLIESCYYLDYPSNGNYVEAEVIKELDDELFYSNLPKRFLINRKYLFKTYRTTSKHIKIP